MKLTTVFLVNTLVLRAGSHFAVDICLDPGVADPYAVARAKQVCSRIMRQAAVELVWSSKPHCPQGAIRIDLLEAAPQPYAQDALAYAKPFEGSTIRVFLNRIIDAGHKKYIPVRLGFALAHEITHILQVSDYHAPEGIMKAKWDPDDLFAMLTWRLRFSPWEVELIQRGLSQRRRAISIE